MLDHFAHRVSVRLRGINLQVLIVHHDDLVRAVAGKVPAKLGNAGAEQNGRHHGLHFLRELFRLAEKLVGDAGDLSVNLLDEHIHALVILNIHIVSPLSNYIMNFSLSFSSM